MSVVLNLVISFRVATKMSMRLFVRPQDGVVPIITAYVAYMGHTHPLLLMHMVIREALTRYVRRN